ncbi:MAG: lytic transglycosylase domain-containing protein [Tangfeifania sp.]
MEKKGWKIFLSLVLVVNTGLIVFFISGSATPGGQEIEGVIESSKFRSVEIPDTAIFAGEYVPLERFDIKEALDRELIVNSYFHSQTIRLIKLAPRYFTIIEPILKEEGIPDDFKYLAVAESGLDPRAESFAGAIGFWQFLSGTARDYGLEVNGEVDERYHVEKATYAACDYLKDAYQKYGSWTMVAAAYNAGMRGVKRQIERQKSVNYYDLLFVEETQRYVFRIIALKLVLEDPEKYNFIIGDEERYPVIPTRDIEISGGVEDFADFALENGINYKLLKDFNPWLRQTYLTNSAGKKYTIKIPVLE